MNEIGSSRVMWERGFPGRLVGPVGRGYQWRYRAEAEAFADRHFTDPELRLDDTAVFLDIDPRTLREALASTGTNWREMLRERRVQRGEELLESTNYLKDIVSHYAMDPRKLALEWKTANRLVELIVPVTEQRTRQGAAVRG